MATIVPLSVRWAPALVPSVAEAVPGRADPATLPPREVWPLLGTIAATALLMLAAIAWQATIGM